MGGLAPAGRGSGGDGDGGGGGGSTTKSVTLSDVPTIFRQAVLQTGMDQYDVTTTWRDLRHSRTEVLGTGTSVELGPVQIGNLDDFVEIFGTGVVYCGSHTSPSGIGVEQKFQYGKADTESGTYSTYADINASTFTRISGGVITFRSKITAGGAGDRRYADYMPATQVASTWEDMGFVATDVGKWIKIIVLHKKPSSDHPDIGQRYGWRLTLKVDSAVDKTVSVTVPGGGGGSALSPLRGLQTWEAEDVDELVNVEGEFFGIEQDHHVGHGKVATPRDLTDTDFVGIVANVGFITGALHGNFYFDLATGSFRIYLVHNMDGFTGRSGFYPYYPLVRNESLANIGLADSRADGPWMDAPAGGTYTGALTWGSVKQTVALAQTAATALGQVFVIPNVHRVFYIDVYSAVDAEYTQQLQKLVVPHYFNNPTLVLWGVSADKRIDDALAGNMVRITTLGENAILKWKLDASEILFGAEAGMVDILTAAEAVAQASLSDVISSIVSSARASFLFKLTPGYWSMNGYSSTGSREATLSILKTGSGVDVVIAQGHRSSTAADDTQAGNVGTPDNANPAILNSPPVKIEASDVLYAVHGDEVAAAQSASAQYLQLVYHGAA